MLIGPSDREALHRQGTQCGECHVGTSVYESAAWTELKKAKPEFAFDLAEGVAAVVLAEKK